MRRDVAAVVAMAWLVGLGPMPAAGALAQGRPVQQQGNCTRAAP